MPDSCATTWDLLVNQMGRVLVLTGAHGLAWSIFLRRRNTAAPRVISGEQALSETQ